MSNRRKPKKPITPIESWPQPGEGEAYVNTAGVVADRSIRADVDHARKATHDSLIELLGDLRRSGVWWTHHTDDAVETAQTLYEVVAGDDQAERVAEVRAETLRWLEKSPDPVLVVAWAIGEVPENVVLA